MKCVFSWDDGSLHDLRLANLFSKYNCEFTLYIPSNNIEGRKVLSPNQIRDLSKICEIGSHTADHVPLNLLKPDAQRFQIERGKNYLEDVLGACVEGFCFPRGKITKHSKLICEDLGIKYARTISPYYKNAFVQKDFYVNVTAQFTKRSYTRNILNMRRNPNILHFATLSRYELVEALTKIICQNSKDDNVIHIWGHSWEIEENNLWNELDTMLKFISDVGAQTQTVMDLYREERDFR